MSTAGCGLAFTSGLDNGDGGGTARDGVLQAGEIGFLVPQDNGTAGDGVSSSVSFTGASLWNYGSCGAGGPSTGWLLNAITRANVYSHHDHAAAQAAVSGAR